MTETIPDSPPAERAVRRTSLTEYRNRIDNGLPLEIDIEEEFSVTIDRDGEEMTITGNPTTIAKAIAAILALNRRRNY